MSSVSRALSVYRGLLREAKKLPSVPRKDYVYKKAREEFSKHKAITDPTELDFQLTLGYKIKQKKKRQNYCFVWIFNEKYFFKINRETQLDNLKVQVKHLKDLFSYFSPERQKQKEEEAKRKNFETLIDKFESDEILPKLNEENQENEIGNEKSQTKTKPWEMNWKKNDMKFEVIGHTILVEFDFNFVK